MLIKSLTESTNVPGREKIAFLLSGVKIQDGGSSPSWMLGVQ